MLVARELKRQNFNVNPEQESELLRLQELLAAPSAKDAILRAVRVLLVLSREVQSGKRLCLTDKAGRLTEVILPELESPSPRWVYLTERPHGGKRQLFVKGRKLSAAQVWLDRRTNGMSEEEAAENWDLPLEAIREIEDYGATHRVLIQMEADEEKLALSGLDLRVIP